MFGKKVLDVGCGVGVFSYLWPNAVFLDSSEAVLFHHPGRARVCADANAMPFCDGAFDTIVAVTTLQFVKETEVVIKETVRALCRKGILVILDDFSRREKSWHRASYKNWHPARWWSERLEIFDVVQIPVTGLDQKIFAWFGSNVLTFALSVLLDPIWKRFSSRYECWICQRK